MGLFSSSKSWSASGWDTSTRKAPRGSAGSGTHRAHVNGDQLGDYRTRGQARRAARAEAARRARADR